MATSKERRRVVYGSFEAAVGTEATDLSDRFQTSKYMAYTGTDSCWVVISTVPLGPPSINQAPAAIAAGSGLVGCRVRRRADCDGVLWLLAGRANGGGVSGGR